MDRKVRGAVVAGMVQALANDIRTMIAKGTAPERAQNPTLIGVVAACAAGLVFHQLLAEIVKLTPENDRATLRAKIMEYAENTVAGLPTAIPGVPRN